MIDPIWTPLWGYTIDTLKLLSNSLYHRATVLFCLEFYCEFIRQIFKIIDFYEALTQTKINFHIICHNLAILENSVCQQ